MLARLYKEIPMRLKPLMSASRPRLSECSLKARKRAQHWASSNYVQILGWTKDPNVERAAHAESRSHPNPARRSPLDQDCLVCQARHCLNGNAYRAASCDRWYLVHGRRRLDYIGTNLEFWRKNEAPASNPTLENFTAQDANCIHRAFQLSDTALLRDDEARTFAVYGL